jgi:hypothetical protein
MTVSRALFLSGLALMTAAWMFDRIAAFPWLLRWIAPSDAAARSVLDELAENARLGILSSHEGFAPLIALWPELHDRPKVTIIGRSAAFTEYGGPAVVNDFELIPYASPTEKLAPVWSARAARMLVQNRIDRKVLDMSRAVFLLGLAVAIVTGWPR